MKPNKLIKNTWSIALSAILTLMPAVTVHAKTAPSVPDQTAASFRWVKSSAAFSSQEEENAPPKQFSSQIYLYGEQHAQEKILEKESELWYEYYHKEGLRHLFIEMPYYTAEFLNLWMKSDNDEILNAIYEDWQGAAAHNPHVKAFYQKIKRECPETIFHGTDVGHQYDTTGKRFLTYLQENGLENSEQYRIARDVMEQGKYFYEHSDDAYRENKMTENFVRAFETLNGESVMGIYGGAHTGIEAMDFSTQSVPSMANQLHASYGDNLHSKDLIWILKEDVKPERTDRITVAGKEYQAAYFGEENLTGLGDFVYRKFWRLENAYDDFKDRPKTGDVLPYNNYPMLVETGQVFVIEYGKTDGSILKGYYRSDGSDWNGMLSTEEFTIAQG